MKYAFLSLLIFSVFACGTNKKVEILDVPPPPQQENHFKRVVGTVVKQDVGCKLFILISHDEDEQKIVPLNLDERFQVNGMKLRFDYTETIPATGSGECKELKSALLEEVSPLRGS